MLHPSIVVGKALTVVLLQVRPPPGARRPSPTLTQAATWVVRTPWYPSLMRMTTTAQRYTDTLLICPLSWKKMIIFLCSVEILSTRFYNFVEYAHFFDRLSRIEA